MSAPTREERLARLRANASEMTEAEYHRELVKVDPLAALCEIVSEAGLTMTLYGHPVSEDALRTFATVKAFDRLGGAEPDDEADADLARALTAAGS